MDAKALQAWIEPYRHADPTGWVGIYKLAPFWAGGIAIAFGVFMLLFGGRRFFRMVAAPLGALIAGVWVTPLAQRLGYTGGTQELVWGAAVVLFLAGVFMPPAVVFMAFGIPAGLLGGQLAGGTDWLLGFGPGFIVGGAAGVILHRLVGAALSALMGAWLFMLGGMCLLAPWVPGVEWLALRPYVVMGAAGVFAAAGTVFQLFVRPTEAVAAAQRQERALEKRRAKEEKALLDRWEREHRKK